MGFEGPVRVARVHARARVFDGAGRIGDLPRVPGASAGSETRSFFDRWRDDACRHNPASAVDAPTPLGQCGIRDRPTEGEGMEEFVAPDPDTLYVTDNEGLITYADMVRDLDEDVIPSCQEDLDLLMWSFGAEEIGKASEPETKSGDAGD
jgi:hypothetical protein